MTKPTKEQVEVEPEGPRIDAWFAIWVMEWVAFTTDKNGYVFRPNTIRANLLFKPSTNIVHAMEGVEKILERDKHNESIESVSLVWPGHTGNGSKIWLFNISSYTKTMIQCEAETAPLAITRALILWALEKGEQQ